MFDNMKLLAVIGGAIAASGLALMSGFAIVDCCCDRSAQKKVAAS
jgi:hypothetical protein